MRKDLRGCEKELNAGELWEYINSIRKVQMTCDQQRSHQILPLNSADSATLRSDSGARMQAFFSARSLIEWANRVLATAAPIQMVMGSIHRVTNLKYPLTVIGHVDGGL